MSDYVVGVTGGIGSGKTTVTDAFARLGVEVVDADVIAREVVAAGSPALKRIAEHFGAEILGEDGELDRAALRQRVFSNVEHKNWLNQLLHPLIRQAIEQQLQAARSAYCILSAPLLLENKLTYLTNRVLVVDVPETLQVERTMQRDNSNADQVEAIMAAQISRQDRLAAADDILPNDGTIEALYAKVAALHSDYLAYAKAQQK